MKKKFLLYVTTLFLCLAMGTGTTSAASPNSTTINSKVYLKINQYYVLYTQPLAPYVDQNYRLMLPLRAVSELMGASVNYDAQNKTVTVNWQGKSVQVTIGSKSVTMNGETSEFDTVPVIKQNTVFVPTRVLLNGLAISGQWDSKSQLLSIKDEKFKQSKVINYLEVDSTPLNPYATSDMDINKIQPLSYTLKLNPATNTTLGSGQLTITAKNISSAAIPEGKEGLHPVFITEKSYQFDSTERERTAVAKDAVFNRSWDISLSNNYTLKYILAIGDVEE